MTENENEQPLGTQELIEDARERRKLKINGKNESLKCDQCNFKTGSKTMLNRHMNSSHVDQQTQEMRVRFSCDVCGYKTTSQVVLKTHKNLNHEPKVKNKKFISKRKTCNMCDKNFNKSSTYNKHMENYHGENK